MKPFPTIWTDGTVASFSLDGHLVQVPIKLGSRDNRAHVIRWLHHLWPFHIMGGARRPMLMKKIDGDKVLLHKVYARLLGHDRVVEAADGDLLHWSVENISPRRKPDQIVPQRSQDHEVLNQMWKRERDGSLDNLTRDIARQIKRDRAETLRMLEAHGVIAADKISTAQTLAVTLQTEWERRLAASRTRADADAARTEEHLETELPQDEFVADPRPESYPDGVVHAPPSSAVETNDNKKAARADEEGWTPQPSIRSSYEYYNLTLEQFRAGLGLNSHPSTELVLNGHGWQTPANGHLPEYCGKEKGKRVQ